jgi:membrane glycosyltransferase
VLERLSTAQKAKADRSGPNMIGRRSLYAVLFGVTMSCMLGLGAVALSAGGFGVIDLAILSLFALTLPWMVIGFWNAVIGFIVMHFARDPMAALISAAADIRGDEPLTTTTAILVCVRNEAPERTIRNLEPMLVGLAATGSADRFHIYVLSDSDAEIAVNEQTRFDALASRWRDRVALTYRRRTNNTGYKAGNIRDFCDRWGRDYDFALVLDADSFMTAAAILRLVRIMQADDKLGILQSLVVGLPPTSAFARLFQFGMRLGMRSYAAGSAWWQGDCGPYWGHNAMVRLEPFIAHCRLPVLSQCGGRSVHILSHDQIEAALMRRAGYDVRVLPIEDSSWEENPPTLIEFIRRDLRWCQGNMQYWRFLTLPGLRAVTRCNLAIAILMFVQSPAWIGMFVLGTLSVAFSETTGAFIQRGSGLVVFVLVLVMWFAPMTASAVDILLRPPARLAFGGAALFLVNLVIEYIFSIMVCPIMWFCHTIFLACLLFGRGIGWIGQTRDDHAVAPTLALRNLWPHALLGGGAIALLATTRPSAIPYALFFAAGLTLAVPLAVVTAMPAVGALLVRYGIGRLPEETAPPSELVARTLAAVEPGTTSPQSQSV